MTFHPPPTPPFFIAPNSQLKQNWSKKLTLDHKKAQYELPGMTKTFSGKNELDMWLWVLFWSMSYLITWRGGIYDLYCSLPPGCSKDIFASLLMSCHAVHRYIRSMEEYTRTWLHLSELFSLGCNFLHNALELSHFSVQQLNLKWAGPSSNFC